MGDYSGATLTIHHIPDDKVAAVIAAIEEHALIDFNGPINAGDPVPLEEQRLNICTELGDTLAELGATFDLFQDAKYEYDGEGRMHLAPFIIDGKPIMGDGEESFDWWYSGGGSGECMVSVAEIDSILADERLHDDDSGREARMRLHALCLHLGTDLRAAMKRCAEANEGKSWASTAVTA